VGRGGKLLEMSKDRIFLATTSIFFGAIGFLTVSTPYEEVRKAVPIETVTTPLADGGCRATSDFVKNFQMFSSGEVLKKKDCGRNGYQVDVSKVNYIRQLGAESITRVVRFALGAALGAILFAVFLRIKPKIKSALERMQSTITTIDSSKIKTPRETTNGEKTVSIIKSSVGNPNIQKKLLATTRMMEMFAAVLVILGIIGAAIIMFTPKCIDDSEYGCLEKDWTTSMTYGLTALFLNFFIMGFVIMITQYINWRIDTESQKV